MESNAILTLDQKPLLQELVLVLAISLTTARSYAKYILDCAPKPHNILKQPLGNCPTVPIFAVLFA